MAQLEQPVAPSPVASVAIDENPRGTETGSEADQSLARLTA